MTYEIKSYLVWAPDEGETREEAATFTALSAADAAELLAAEHYADGGLCDGDSMCIVVECPDGSVVEYAVEADVAVDFWAHPVVRPAKTPAPILLDNPEVKV